MGIANYTNLSELMNRRLKTGTAVSIAELVTEAMAGGLILASEGTLADRAELENGFIDLADVLRRNGAIRPEPADASEEALVGLYLSGKLAENGYGGPDGDRFLEIRWRALTEDLPVIVNL